MQIVSRKDTETRLSLFWLSNKGPLCNVLDGVGMSGGNTMKILTKPLQGRGWGVLKIGKISLT